MAMNVVRWWKRASVQTKLSLAMVLVITAGLVLWVVNAQKPQEIAPHASDGGPQDTRVETTGGDNNGGTCKKPSIYISTDGTTFIDISGKGNEGKAPFSIPAGTTTLKIKAALRSDATKVDPRFTARIIWGKFGRKKGAVCVNRACDVTLPQENSTVFFEAFQNEGTDSIKEQLYRSEKCRSTGGVKRTS